jgi:DnaJ-class molecular chaperone
MARKHKLSWWAGIRPKGAPLCRACNGTGLKPGTRLICRTCRGWGY